MFYTQTWYIFGCAFLYIELCRVQAWRSRHETAMPKIYVGFDSRQNRKMFSTLVAPLEKQWQTIENILAKSISLINRRSESCTISTTDIWEKSPRSVTSNRTEEEARILGMRFEFVHQTHGIIPKRNRCTRLWAIRY